ncbi:hypothetical protein G9A89_015606 [Geosiphon pyriformis]|nr:hypothetical protein G9A89_015606 [Geosiphon pyriformis]
MGLPNLVVVYFKRTERIALTRILREYIQFSYSEHPDAYTDDFRVLDELRGDCVNLEVHHNALNRLLKYYGQLVFIGSKFPIDVGIEFPWSLAFSEDKRLIAHRNFFYEKACVLFNIGAMYSQLGVAENRFTAAGVKKASQHFQCAAGCFTYLNEVIIPEMRIPPTVDMSITTLNVLRNVMLAQAQECFWQKAVNDKMKDGTIAKLAGQVADFYETAHELSVNDSNVSQLLGQQFITHLQGKSWHFLAGSEFRKSSENISQNKYGDEIARLKVAESLIKRALGLQKNLRDSVINDLKSLEKPINDNLVRAEKDNDLIYLHSIPSASSLPPIGRAKMVEATVPPEVKDPISLMNERSILGEPLFVQLVPFAVHQAISVYFDRKDTLVREIIGRLLELTNTCKSTLQSLKLQGALEALEEPVGLPPTLIQKSNEVRQAGGLEVLKEKLERVQELEHNDTTILEEAFALLDQEIAEDEEIREKYAEKWQLPPSDSVNQELVQQGVKYRDVLNAARNGDHIIARKLEDWSTIIELLNASQDKLLRAVPASTQTYDDSNSCVSQLRGLYNQAQRLMNDREERIAEVQKFGNSDDIGPDLRKEAAKITAKGIGVKIESAHFEDFFAQHLNKYDPYLQLVKSETDTQEKLITSIVEINQRLLETRQRSDAANLGRIKAVQNLEIGYEKFKEILKNLREGEQFYRSFGTTLIKWKNDCKTFVESRRHYSQNHLEQLTKTFSGMSISNPQPSAPPASQIPQSHDRLNNSNELWNNGVGLAVNYEEPSQSMLSSSPHPSSPVHPIWTKGMPVSFVSSSGQRSPTTPNQTRGATWTRGRGIHFNGRN